mmetsp:Transcript_100497/g.313209  ORF Transcript_100497/g.313209 Transcript_100497/m.313209 type:complete len:203 (-) Transcript_100497:124-732(-)
MEGSLLAPEHVAPHLAHQRVEPAQDLPARDQDRAPDEVRRTVLEERPLQVGPAAQGQGRLHALVVRGPQQRQPAAVGDAGQGEARGIRLPRLLAEDVGDDDGLVLLVLGPPSLDLSARLVPPARRVLDDEVALARELDSVEDVLELGTGPGVREDDHGETLARRGRLGDVHVGGEVGAVEGGDPHPVQRGGLAGAGGSGQPG